MLNKTDLSSIKLAHISLAIVGLMWVLPFLYYHHAYPITTFYQEWGAGMLGLCAFPLLLTSGYWKDPEVPRAVLLPLGMLLLLLIQFALRMTEHFDRVLMLSLYFMFAALLMMLGRQLVREIGLPTVAVVLAGFLLVGAELNTLAGVLQHYRWNTILNPFVTAKVSSAVYGNTAQANHFADFLALGLISLGLLHVRLGLRWRTVLLLASPMLFVMALSGSRSSWLYLVGATAFAYLLQRLDKQLRPLLIFGAILLIEFALMHFVIEIPWLQGGVGNVSTTERMFGDNASGQIRLHLWKEAAWMFIQSPVLGFGFGQFAIQHLNLPANMHSPLIAGLYNNAHNIVMQIAVEGGGVGVAILLGGVGAWFYGIWRSRGAPSIYHWWGYSSLLVIGIHSLLEYPLWYAYFMGIFALLFGMFDATSYKLELKKVGQLSLWAIWILSFISLTQAYIGYRHLENGVAARALVAKDRNNLGRVRDELMRAHESSLLSSYSELFMANLLQPGADHLQDRFELNQRAMRFIPVAPVVYRHAAYLALMGREDEAKTQIERAIWAYPADFVNARTELARLAVEDPGHISVLLEFANRKYEEYRSVAVPAK